MYLICPNKESIGFAGFNTKTVKLCFSVIGLSLSSWNSEMMFKVVSERDSPVSSKHINRSNEMLVTGPQF
jgi:hypothetical protein